MNVFDTTRHAVIEAERQLRAADECATDDEPLDAALARQAANVLVDVGYANEPDELALRAISEGRHVVIEAGELDAIRETIRQQDLLLDERKAELERLRADARRYRLLRKCYWYTSPFAVVRNPREAVKLGHDCLSLDRLDAAIDAAQQEGCHED